MRLFDLRQPASDSSSGVQTVPSPSSKPSVARSKQHVVGSKQQYHGSGLTLTLTLTLSQVYSLGGGTLATSLALSTLARRMLIVVDPA